MITLRTLYDFLLEFEVRLGLDFKCREFVGTVGVAANLFGWSLIACAAYLIAAGRYWHLLPLCGVAYFLRPRPRLVRQFPGLEGRVHPWKLGFLGPPGVEWEVGRDDDDPDGDMRDSRP